MTYIRVTLSTLAVAGQPGPLPAELVGLDLASLADLPAAIDPVPSQFKGVGYWPVVEGDVSEPQIDKAGRRYLVPIPPEPELQPAPFPDLSDRQFFQALATPPYGIITQAEALDAVKTGEIPPVMQAVIDELPEDQVFPTAMILSGATSFERSSPLVAVFGGSQGMNADDIDAFWRFAEAL